MRIAFNAMQAHSIANTGSGDLLLLTIVSER